MDFINIEVTPELVERGKNEYYLHASEFEDKDAFVACLIVLNEWIEATKRKKENEYA